MAKPITWQKELRQLASEKGRTLFAFGIDSGPNMRGVQRYTFIQTGAVPHELAEKMLKSIATMYNRWLKEANKPTAKKKARQA